MVVKPISTPLGWALPPHPEHSITGHLPGWEQGVLALKGDMSIMQQMKSIYPRFGVVFNVQTFTAAVTKKLGFAENKTAMIFAAPDAVATCKTYALSADRKEHRLDSDDLDFRAIEMDKIRLYVVGFPAVKAKGILGYWQHCGTGISSRLAVQLLPHVDTLTEIPIPPGGPLPSPTYFPKTSAHGELRERISSLLNRGRAREGAVPAGAEDVFLFPTGMSAIYRLHYALTEQAGATSVALGSLFHSTEEVLRDFGPGYTHLPSGETAALRQHLERETAAGRRVQAVYAEFPSNPNLGCVALAQLRALADQHGFVLVLDDTLAGFCNADVLAFADVLATSLTKSFSGYADVMGGSLVLNAGSPKYTQLAALLGSLYGPATGYNEYFAGDAAAMLANSRDYLSRAARLHANATAIARYLQTKAEDPRSSVTAVMHPATDPAARAEYEQHMPPATAEYAPGYGTLLSVRFARLEQARFFYDTLETHKGPHLGANYTLALPYNNMLYTIDPSVLDKGGPHGFAISDVRIAPGIEDQQDLLDAFRDAVDKTDAWAHAQAQTANDKNVVVATAI